ncbi:OmpH family outer membrane protein [Novosphingobium sp.]|uniref:OmpH family outer membrane protein n=1 Tax=Novosphingobium sp. TaxID=1874826 RepID=UPI0027329E68|nr:OmpH family outer membrane protein [Novosphingobium sp.]MDP3907295.1 OmpH family outer membrane protein [Novosphingobium sp.]
MTKFSKPALVAGLLLAVATAQPALAAKDKKKGDAAPVAAAAGPVAVQGIAVASLDAAIAGTNAFRVAEQQRPVTYKPNFDGANARGQALENQLKPLVAKFEADRQAAKPNVPALQQQARVLQELQERGKQEIQQQLMPVALSEAYVAEQIEAKLDQAVQQAMTKYNVSLLLQPNAVIARSVSYDLTDEIVAELNLLVPSAQLVPPTGWEPRQVREARAQQAAQAAAAQGGAAPAPRPVTPAGPQPEGR